MGFIREWYRDNCVEPGEKRAKMFLADGEYADAASEFQSCGMYNQAADAYMKAGRKKSDSYYYQWAAESYEKAGDFEAMRKAYEIIWKIQGKHAGIKELATHGQLERFCENVCDNAPRLLACELESSGEHKLAGDMFLAASEMEADETERYYSDSGQERKYSLVRNAIEQYIKAEVPKDELLVLHEKLIRLDTDDEDRFRHESMGWVIRSGKLAEFVEHVVHDVPLYLWRSLYDIDWSDKEAAALDPVGQARAMSKCVRVSRSECPTGQSVADVELVHNVEPNWAEITAGYLECVQKYLEAVEMYLAQTEFTPDAYNSDKLMEKAAECYKKASRHLKAAVLLEQLGKLKEAAESAGDAGNRDLAIRLYEQALKEDDVRATEAKWIKTTLKRLRKGEDGPSIDEAKSPVIIPGEPRRNPPQQESVRTCPQCVNQISKEDSFYKGDNN